MQDEEVLENHYTIHPCLPHWHFHRIFHIWYGTGPGCSSTICPRFGNVSICSLYGGYTERIDARLEPSVYQIRSLVVGLWSHVLVGHLGVIIYFIIRTVLVVILSMILV